MDYYDNINIVNLTITGLKQMAAHNFTIAYELDNSPRLTTIEHKSVNTLKLINMNINRLCNTLSYLVNSENNIYAKKVESYDIEPMMNEFLSEFERMTSPYTALSISFTSKLKNAGVITLSKTHFEFIILNLLYCCIKPAPRQNDHIKITVSVSETQDDIVFHIYDNSKFFDPNKMDLSIQSSGSLLEQSYDNSSSYLIALSLRMAQKAAADMNGRLEISSLKSSNRYDVYLPKTVTVPQYTMCSPVLYTPTYEYYNEILADIKLEYILTRVIESFEGEFEGVHML